MKSTFDGFERNIRTEKGIAQRIRFSRTLTQARAPAPPAECTKLNLLRPRTPPRRRSALCPVRVRHSFSFALGAGGRRKRKHTKFPAKLFTLHERCERRDAESLHPLGGCNCDCVALSRSAARCTSTSTSTYPTRKRFAFATAVNKDSLCHGNAARAHTRAHRSPTVLGIRMARLRQQRKCSAIDK